MNSKLIELREMLEKHGSVFTEDGTKVIFSETTTPLNEDEEKKFFDICNALNVKTIEQVDNEADLA